MPIPKRETFATTRSDLMVQVTDDGSRTLLRKGTTDAFHSGCGAVAESKHVYLHNSGVLARLQNGQPTRVLEVGLGTSMAMLMTLKIAIENKTAITYVALENDWISADVFKALSPLDWCQDRGLQGFDDQDRDDDSSVDRYVDLIERYQVFRQSLPDSVPLGQYEWDAGSDQIAKIIVGDAGAWQPIEITPFDAIYFDPFCQESCPDLWTENVFRKMRGLAADGCRLTTYSCSRSVRDAMEAAGWSPKRVAGPVGGKREVLVAV